MRRSEKPTKSPSNLVPFAFGMVLATALGAAALARAGDTKTYSAAMCRPYSQHDADGMYYDGTVGGIRFIGGFSSGPYAGGVVACPLIRDSPTSAGIEFLALAGQRDSPGSLVECTYVSRAADGLVADTQLAVWDKDEGSSMNFLWVSPGLTSEPHGPHAILCQLPDGSSLRGYYVEES